MKKKLTFDEEKKEKIVILNFKEQLDPIVCWLITIEMNHLVS